MAFDYVDLASSVDELIEEFGAPILLTRNANAEYNVETSEVEGSDRRWRGRAARFDYRLSDIDGEQIRRGDARFLVSPIAEGGGAMEQPKVGDRVRFDGEWWRVLDCGPLKPATTSVRYAVQARK